MKYNCDVIQDLLPLYQDSICSGASKKMVEEHLKECVTCRKIAAQMNDQTVEEKLMEEKRTVIGEHEKKIRKKTTTVGIVTAGILLIPVLICLICNIAIGHALDWFFIVLTAMLLAASVLVVPMVAEKRKAMWTIVTATGSLILLLLTCCIYTHGDWFFVAASGSILGISVVFAPVVVTGICADSKMKKHRAAITILWDTIWLYLLLIVCGIYVHGSREYWEIAITVATYCMIPVWMFVFVLAYLQKNGWIKAGILTAVTGSWLGLCNNILNVFLSDASGYGVENLDLSKGFFTNDMAVLNANILFTMIVVSVCLGGCFIFIGKRKEKQKNEMEN
ncbi:MAG: zf-HC2 domain-containing protein [Lachnospiraceae bacterium]